MDISGKKAVVFGGTSGIGLATCHQLIAAGAEVVAVSRDPNKAVAGLDGVKRAAVDARDSDAVSAFFEAEGPIDILISSATGGSRAFGPFLQMDIDGFKSSFDKLWGYSNVVRYGTAQLRDNGCIVLVSGTPARKMKPGQVALSAVGGAVEVARRSAPYRGVSPLPSQRQIGIWRGGYHWYSRWPRGYSRGARRAPE